MKQLNTYVNKNNFAAKDYKLKKKEKVDRICAHYLLKRDEVKNSGAIEAHDEAGTSDSDETEVVAELRDFSNSDTYSDMDIPSNDTETVTPFERKRKCPPKYVDFHA